MAESRATAIEGLARRFARFAEVECRGVSSLYERLALGTAGDAELLGLAAEARAGQPVSNLLLGAVHLLLLKGARHPLAGFYPSVAGGERGRGDPFPAFREFCLEQRAAIGELLRTRIVQTNEVRRSALLLPAFGLVARRAGGRPLALVELGASAGLNLLFDRYQYDYGDGRQYGELDSAVLIVCATRGERYPPLPKQLPAVASRVGIDLEPVDPADPEAALWLRALVWPEHEARAALLKRALEVARAEPPRLVKGDALEVLPGVMAEAAAEATLCVFHTHTLNQFTPEGRERLAGILDREAGRRDVYRVSVEGFGRPWPALELTTYEGSAGREELLARCDAHGAWIAWVAGEEDSR